MLSTMIVLIIIAFVVFIVLWGFLRIFYSGDFENSCASAYVKMCENGSPQKNPLLVYENHRNFTFALLRKFLFFSIFMVVIYFSKWDLSYLYIPFFLFAWYIYIHRRKFYKNFCNGIENIGVYDQYIIEAAVSGSYSVLKVSIILPLYQCLLLVMMFIFTAWYL